MKSIRELILGRHRKAEAKLESMIQAEDLARLARDADAPAVRPYQEQGHEVSATLPWLREFWAEAFCPWRRVWIGIGVVWAVILFVQLIGAPTSTPTMAQLPVSNPTVAALLREQRELLSR